jgi:3-hydroxyacyl-CoA dehydrogenase
MHAIINEVTTLCVEDGVGIVTVDSPPVNALGVQVRRGLDAAFRQLAADSTVQAVILICGGRTFFAGADIFEMGQAPSLPTLQAVFDIIENGAKLVVAAIHGTALGGGLEVALTCHYRIAVPSAKVGMPEVNLGLLPGGGGTQRLPRIVGVERALEMMTAGKPIDAQRALVWGVLDALANEGQLRRDAIAFAHAVLTERRPLKRVRDRDDKVAEARGKPQIFAAFRAENAHSFRGFKAPDNIIKAVEAAVHLPFEQGLVRERELFRELRASTESAAQRYAFFAERQCAKVVDVPADTPTLPIHTVGIFGDDATAGDIAMNFLNVGLPVTLVAANAAVLAQCIGVIRKKHETRAAIGCLTEEQVEQRMGLLSPGLELAALCTADLVIEAVFENMDTKTQVFAQLDGIAKLGAILASNTAFLDLEQIAAMSRRPECVIGVHFFAPADTTRLLEVVRVRATGKSAIATAMKLAKQIGKVPLLSRVCPGFIANRLMNPRHREGDALLRQGATQEQIDRAVADFGFAPVTLQMRGNKGKNGALSALGDEPTAAHLREFEMGAHNRLSAGHIVARLLYPVVNEGARILEEGVAMRASDVDVAATLGFGWPVYRGGPMFWADTVGLPTIVAMLKDLQAQGDSTGPCALLQQLAEAGRKLHEI